jgi:hypothetical protein
MAYAPVAGPLVVMPARLQGEDAPGVPDGQGADPLMNRPGDDGAGRLVLSLADPAPVPGLCQPLTMPELAPAPWHTPIRPAATDKHPTRNTPQPYQA